MSGTPFLIRSPLIGLPHGFTTRRGGRSGGPFAGLNLDDRQDDPVTVAENRRLAAGALGYRLAEVARLEQVHGLEVLPARPGVQTGDALVTADPDLLLAIGTADCYPILLADEEAGVIGAAHAGWRGTVGRIAERTLAAMTELGARPERTRAAIGVGICAAQYPVGAEVAQTFAAAGLGDHLDGKRHLDLGGANRQVLLEAGLAPQHLWQAGGCSTEADFYSYRRDAGVTGRMWGLIGLRQQRAGSAAGEVGR
ncbi:Multi-copper polyphenol oxidoreductase, laccase [Deinococcus proteolyticus MRP]|uniref:Multi-copper polyphenol oxidoreductase, laccase n=1 Tax=Deinococcus proteolyticus (strain ATCC 35074 / DSM 20540 / JCM 6276 / NBRC 101906 / NCIMB 13154 / VKM Ac-1939 / CCM 2703 / MRP) TaxID=693977 RepID=F0RPC2_DEIPM|nr:polyphenol oxidase family protein [Deinococcus proteolyticus]ADY26465.1 Multi-copper polyphenol oxidoreductase, laccase [Deinococcus proteolyticus MRP]